MNAAESSIPNDLSKMIRVLGDLLGQTIVQQEGLEMLELEEKIRGLAKSGRGGSEAALSELRKVVAEMSDDTETTDVNLKAPCWSCLSLRLIRPSLAARRFARS